MPALVRGREPPEPWEARYWLRPGTKTAKVALVPNAYMNFDVHEAHAASGLDVPISRGCHRRLPAPVEERREEFGLGPTVYENIDVEQVEKVVWSQGENAAFKDDGADPVGLREALDLEKLCAGGQYPFDLNCGPRGEHVI